MPVVDAFSSQETSEFQCGYLRWSSAPDEIGTLLWIWVSKQILMPIYFTPLLLLSPEKPPSLDVGSNGVTSPMSSTISSGVI
jgi:hypothetical protein